jgi:hypothetical protein
MSAARHRHHFCVLAALLMGCLAAAAGADAPPRAPLVADDFARFDTSRWAVEAEDGAATVYAKDHALYLDTARGLTVWLREKLAGHYEVTFTRTVLAERQEHDRLSDLNLFWQASLPDGGAQGRFARSGKFEDYDGLRLWYAGIGGNGNTTTRFRYYDGSGARTLLTEYLAPPYLLVANHAYRIRLVVDGAGSALYVDGVRFFQAPAAFVEGGYFGLRTTKSRQRISDFSIQRLP